MSEAALAQPLEQPARRTTLYDWHVKQGAKMVPFAGYDMPVQYGAGIIAEHNHTRSAASLFDVSHMGQVVLRGTDAVRGLEKYIPGDVQNLKPGQMRYSTMLNEWGGVIDDLMIVRPDTGYDLWAVVNASRKEHDFGILKQSIPLGLAELTSRDLLALQGPAAASVLHHYIDVVDRINFLQAVWTKIKNIPVLLMRSGYTGEDGFEISCEPKHTESLADLLMQHDEVQPAGLGARDTLRLEAGLCLYGHELTEKITPIEAGLKWVVSKERLAEGEFSGASIIEAELLNLPERARIGLVLDDRAPAREGTPIHDLHDRPVGEVTSGGFSPTLNKPIAMGYVERHLAVVGTTLNLIVRGRALTARVAPLPFVPHRYVQKGKAL